MYPAPTIMSSNDKYSARTYYYVRILHVSHNVLLMFVKYLYHMLGMTNQHACQTRRMYLTVDGEFVRDAFPLCQLEGFPCQGHGGTRTVKLRRGRCNRERRSCRRQISAMAEIFMHSLYISLKSWFHAVHLMTDRPSKISMPQLQHQLAPGIYKFKWLRTGFAGRWIVPMQFRGKTPYKHARRTPAMAAST